MERGKGKVKGEEQEEEKERRRQREEGTGEKEKGESEEGVEGMQEKEIMIASPRVHTAFLALSYVLCMRFSFGYHNYDIG